MSDPDRHPPQCASHGGANEIERIIKEWLGHYVSHLPPTSEVARAIAALATPSGADVRAATIEECARICDADAELAEKRITRNPSSPSSQMFATISNAAGDCAAAIRALLADTRPNR